MRLIKCNIYLAKHADCGINPGLRSFLSSYRLKSMEGSRMEKNIYYPLDYGWYDSKEKWNHFCSSKCRFFRSVQERVAFVHP